MSFVRSLARNGFGINEDFSCCCMKLETEKNPPKKLISAYGGEKKNSLPQSIDLALLISPEREKLHSDSKFIDVFGLIPFYIYMILYRVSQSY